MRRESLAYTSKGGRSEAWEAACARAGGAVQIRSMTQDLRAQAAPEHDGAPSFAGFGLPDGLTSLLFVLAFSPAS